MLISDLFSVLWTSKYLCREIVLLLLLKYNRLRQYYYNIITRKIIASSVLYFTKTMEIDFTSVFHFIILNNFLSQNISPIRFFGLELLCCERFMLSANKTLQSQWAELQREDSLLSWISTSRFDCWHLPIPGDGRKDERMKIFNIKMRNLNMFDLWFYDLNDFISEIKLKWKLVEVQASKTFIWMLFVARRMWHLSSNSQATRHKTYTT